MYYDGNHMGAAGWVFMALIAIVLLGLFAAFIVWLMRDQRHRPHHTHYPVGGVATEILDRRLATGEISVQEYEPQVQPRDTRWPATLAHAAADRAVDPRRHLLTRERRPKRRMREAFDWAVRR